MVKRKAYYPDGQGLHVTCPSFPAHDHTLLIFWLRTYILFRNSYIFGLCVSFGGGMLKCHLHAIQGKIIIMVIIKKNSNVNLNTRLFYIYIN